MSAQRIEMSAGDLRLLAESMGHLDVVEVTVDRRIAENYWHLFVQTPGRYVIGDIIPGEGVVTAVGPTAVQVSHSPCEYGEGNHHYWIPVAS